MVSSKSGWKNGLLIVAVVSVSVFVFLIVGAGMALLWAVSTATSLGEPTAKAVIRAIAVAESPTLETQGTARLTDDPLRLHIELQDGTFDIRPGPPGTDVTVEGNYAAPYYELVEERGIAPDGGPTMRIGVRPTRSILVRIVAALRSHGDGAHNDLSVTIPEGVAIDLVLRLRAGETHTDLGGLTLVDLEADLSMGEHRLDFSRPLARPMPRARVSGRMGDIALENLGNARALEFETSSRMGNFNVDLGGDWPVESVAELVFQHSMGDLRLNVPDSVRIAADSESSVRLGESGVLATAQSADDSAGPVVRLRVSTTMGETRFRRY